MTIRTFLAFDLGDSVREALARFQTRLQQDLPPLAWAKPSAMHLTLKFLGNIDPSQVETIRESLGPFIQGAERSSLEIQGLGVFPNARMPRTLWVGVSGEMTPLLDLVNGIERELEGLGFPRESRPYHPHLTLARIKNGWREVGKSLEAKGILAMTPSFGRFQADRVTLFKSELKPGGSVYTRLWDLTLGEAEPKVGEKSVP